MGGLGGNAAQYAQGYPKASEVGYIERIIDKIAAEGATMIYVDEPWSAPNDPSRTATSAMSIAYNVRASTSSTTTSTRSIPVFSSAS
jgi:hypothetical protein